MGVERLLSFAGLVLMAMLLPLVISSTRHAMPDFDFGHLTKKLDKGNPIHIFANKVRPRHNHWYYSSSSSSSISFISITVSELFSLIEFWTCLVAEKMKEKKRREKTWGERKSCGNQKSKVVDSTWNIVLGYSCFFGQINYELGILLKLAISVFWSRYEKIWSYLLSLPSPQFINLFDLNL